MPAYSSASPFRKTWANKQNCSNTILTALECNPRLTNGFIFLSLKLWDDIMWIWNFQWQRKVPSHSCPQESAFIYRVRDLATNQLLVFTTSVASTFPLPTFSVSWDHSIDPVNSYYSGSSKTRFSFQPFLSQIRS